MNQQQTAAPLTDERRREIFAALVAYQDERRCHGAEALAESRAAICERFDIDLGQLRAIERDGIEEDWPPLSRLAPAADGRPDREGPDREDEEGDPTA